MVSKCFIVNETIIELISKYENIVSWKIEFDYDKYIFNLPKV